MYERSLANLPSRRQNSHLFPVALERNNPGSIPREGSEVNERRSRLAEAIALCHAIDRQTARFLSKIFQDMADCDGNPQVLYATLELHHELLGDRFAERLSRVVMSILPTLVQDRSMELGTGLVNLGGLIWNYPQGRQATNIETAIACCETALPMFPCSRPESQRWGATHDNLAFAYSERLRGDRINNLSRSFSHYQYASQVFIRHPFPQQWLTLRSSP
jgi:hypothetical protein